MDNNKLSFTHILYEYYTLLYEFYNAMKWG